MICQENVFLLSSRKVTWLFIFSSLNLPSTPQHLFRSPVGQNLWASSGRTSNPAVAVAAWHDEIRYYDYDSNTCEPNKACGHYTQVNVANISKSQFCELIVKVDRSLQGFVYRAWQNSRLCHHAERALTSDWSVKSFIVAVYQNFLSCFEQTVLSELEKKQFSQTTIKTIYAPVSSECSSFRVYWQCH